MTTLLYYLRTVAIGPSKSEQIIELKECSCIRIKSFNDNKKFCVKTCVIRLSGWAFISFYNL